jgi:formylglycine-generating enzyme required for sulfatase activity
MRFIGRLSVSAIFVVVLTEFCMDASSAEITITNSTTQPLSYRVRYPGKIWGELHEIAPAKTERYNSSENLEFEMNLEGEQQTWTLVAGKSYEYASVAGLPATLFDSTKTGKNAAEKPSPKPRPSTSMRPEPLLPPHAGDPPPETKFTPHEFKVLAVADRTFRDRSPEWQERAKQIVAGASHYFEELFNIRFSVVDCQPWQLKADARNFSDTWGQLYGIDPGEADLVIGFVGVTYPTEYRFGSYRLGQSSFFGQHVYISDDKSLEKAVRTLIHELGHVLGAFHVADMRSIMYPLANSVAPHFEFGKAAMEVFQNSQGIDLRRGVETLSPESARAIKELHSRFVHPAEANTPNPVAMGYVYQSLRADTLGNPVRAKAMAKHATDWSPNCPLAYDIVGAVAVRQGYLAEAQEAYHQVTKLDPTNATAWIRLSACLLDTADAAAAGSAAEHACELTQIPDAIRLRALAEFLTDNRDAYERDLQQLKTVAPPVAAKLEASAKGDLVKQMSTEHAIREEAARVTTVKNSLGMAFVPIRPDAMEDHGRFQMGSAPDEKWRSSSERRHWVVLTKPYQLGQTEVTQGQFERVMGTHPSQFGHGEAELPVENVSWDEAAEFCRRLSDLPEERQENRSYRLPTEAEWEYACRAGSAEKYPFGDNDHWLRNYAWIVVNREPIKTLAVGQKGPNRWGLYDMLGNVGEWCADWYGDLPDEEQTDPTGPSTGKGHVSRGGSWSVTSGPPRSATRSVFTFQEKSNTVGFRVVMVSR